MKQLFMLLLSLSFLIAQNIYASEHSDFGTFWNFQKGKPESQEAYTDFHMKMFGRYGNPELFEFEQEEQALLFGQIKYHFDNGLELDEFHENPHRHTISKMWKALHGYSKCTEKRYNPKRDHTPMHDKELKCKSAKFHIGMLELAAQFAGGYDRLSPEEKKASASYPYARNGIYHPNAGARIFGDVEKASKSLNKAGISKTETDVLTDSIAMVERFRAESCVKEDAWDEYDREYRPIESHKCVYAGLLKEYVELAQKTL